MRQSGKEALAELLHENSRARLTNQGREGAKPRLLDLFCGAGGAAMGYHRAGFEVVGVDSKPQPNYPFDFHQGDALNAEEWRWIGPVDAVHASPPCQHYSQATAWRGNRDDHPDLIEPTREMLKKTGLPYVLENVEAARDELIDPVLICGDDVDLPIHRRRYFETNWPLDVSGLVVQHEQRRAFMHKAERAYADAMGCDWMTNRESRQAIPPAYTERIGRQLMQYLLEPYESFAASQGANLDAPYEGEEIA